MSQLKTIDLSHTLVDWAATAKDIINESVDALYFSDENQINQLLNEAIKNESELKLRRGFHRIVVVSLNEKTSQALIANQFFPDFKNYAPDEGSLTACHQQKISWVQSNHVRTNLSLWGEAEKTLCNNSPFMRACRGEPNTKIPLWLMRQAGRYMAEYQVLRTKVPFKELCKQPDIATQATLDALERLGVSAAIIFSDILLICESMGMQLDYHEGKGPVLTKALESEEDINQLKNIDTKESLSFVMKAISQTRLSMKPHIPLIGFAGAPFTVASYMVEGHSTKEFKKVRSLMNDKPKAWAKLMEKLTSATIDYIKAQIESGAQAIQLFESWANALTPTEYETFVLPYSRQIFESIPKNVPSIHFGSFSLDTLPLMKKAGGDVMSIDYLVDIQKADAILGPQTAIQGNLNPHLLFEKPDIFIPEVKKLLDLIGKRPGYIFNLGRGIMPKTPVDHVLQLVEYVKSFSN